MRPLMLAARRGRWRRGSEDFVSSWELVVAGEVLKLVAQ